MIIIYRYFEYNKYYILESNCILIQIVYWDFRSMKKEIINLCIENDIDVLDIKLIQTIALKIKRYDLLVYLNNNASEYISYAKKHKEAKHLGSE